jgi:formate dehydrogenase subunit delta
VSSAKIDKLARMANQIGDYFAPQPEAKAVDGVANHLKRFWTPKMIGELIDAVGSGREGLNPTVLAAIEKLRNERATTV